jgi:PAS domain-containing protein
MYKKPTYQELESRVQEFEKTESEYKKTIKELQLNEERFRNLYEQMPLGYQSLDLKGCFIEVNKHWLDIMGYSRSRGFKPWELSEADCQERRVRD